MNRALVLLDCNETGGTGVYAKRLVDFLSERYSLHISLKTRIAGSETLDFFREKARSVSYDYLLFPRVDAFLSRVARRLGVSLFYDFVRDGFVSRRLIAKRKPDVIIVSQGGGCNYFRFLLTRIPVVLVAHSLFASPIGSNRFGRLYASFYSGLDTSSKRIVNVSEYANALFKRHIHCPELASVARAICNYGDRIERERTAAERLVVLTLGHLEGYKNPEVWLATARRLCELYPGRFAFIWAGDGSRLKEFREKAAGQDAIRFVGFCRDPSDLYRKADLYFQPSIWESQGIAVVEALGAGLPCVVSNAGGLPESVEEGAEGYLSDPMSVDGYIGSFVRLMNDPALRMEMGERAKRKFQGTFTKAAWEAKMSALLAELSPGKIHEKALRSSQPLHTLRRSDEQIEER